MIDRGPSPSLLGLNEADIDGIPRELAERRIIPFDPSKRRRRPTSRCITPADLRRIDYQRRLAELEAKRPTEHAADCSMICYAAGQPLVVPGVACTCCLDHRQRIFDLERRVEELEAEIDERNQCAMERGRARD